MTTSITKRQRTARRQLRQCQWRHFQRVLAFIFAPTKRSRRPYCLSHLIFLHGHFCQTLGHTFTIRSVPRCAFVTTSVVRRRENCLLYGKRYVGRGYFIRFWSSGSRSFHCCWHRGRYRVFGNRHFYLVLWLVFSKAWSTTEYAHRRHRCWLMQLALAMLVAILGPACVNACARHFHCLAAALCAFDSCCHYGRKCPYYVTSSRVIAPSPLRLMFVCTFLQTVLAPLSCKPPLGFFQCDSLIWRRWAFWSWRAATPYRVGIYVANWRCRFVQRRGGWA